MATIADRITRTIPNVESDLTDKFTANPSYADIKNHALDRAKRDLFNKLGLDVQPEGGLDELVKDWLADKACTYVLEAAADFYKSLALADNIDEHNRQFYNRVTVCETARARLMDRCDDNMLDVAQIVLADAQPAVVPLVGSRGAYKITQDPFARARPWR